MLRRDLLKLLPPTLLGVAISPEQYLNLSTMVNTAWSSGAQSETISTVADLIIPRTDTPGAIDAGVPSFIEHIVKNIQSKVAEDRFYSGLERFEATCSDQFGTAFSNLSQADQERYLSEKIDAKDPFIKDLHALTLTAYFTSQQGMTEALVYDPIPMNYQPCVEVTESTKATASYY